MHISNCGCTTDLDPEVLVTRSVTKCQFHLDHQNPITDLDYNYYADAGVFKNSIPQFTSHIREITETLGCFPRAISGSSALEIGAGISPYCAQLLRKGYDYVAIEPSRWAAEWLEKTYSVEVVNLPMEKVQPSHMKPEFELVLAVHVLEHVINPLDTLHKIHEMTVRGGLLYLIVPDDTDLCNPDHLWFFNENSLRQLLVRCGFTIEKLEIRKVVEHENFIYVKAIKNG